MAGKKLKFTSNFPELPSIGGANFETAQHINKEIIDVSSVINVLKDGTKLVGITHTVLRQPGEKIDKTLIKRNVIKLISGCGTHSPSVSKYTAAWWMAKVVITADKSLVFIHHFIQNFNTGGKNGLQCKNNFCR